MGTMHSGMVLTCQVYVLHVHGSNSALLGMRLHLEMIPPQHAAGSGLLCVCTGPWSAVHHGLFTPLRVNPERAP